MADLTIDTSGFACPLPILKAKSALARIPVGATLEVVATDPGAPADFDAFCHATGHALEASRSERGVFRFLIRRTT